MSEQPTSDEKVCKCDLRTRLVGDGCEVCNPERAADLSFAELLAYLRAESSQYPKNILQIKGSEAAALVDELERAVEEICRERATPPITRARLRHALAGVDWRKAR